MAFMALISAAAGSLVMYLASLSEGVNGGEDSYNHYLIAKYSWKYPSDLLLDQWGKPIYNILASGFAQFGLLGLTFFNVLLWIASAWFVYWICKELGFKHAVIGFVLSLASPIFFDNLISGLTEPLFAFLLTLTVLLFVKDKLIPAAIIAGFLPYARSEGYVILAALGFYLIFIKKEFKPFLYLILGSVVLNFIGWAAEGDPFWIYTSNPYIHAQVENKQICGSGGALHYVRSLSWMMSKPRLFLFVLGGLILTFTYLNNRKSDTQNKLVYVVLGTYALYFFVHSAIWYFGKMGSCGYQRVMLVIEPLAAILMAYPLEKLTKWLSQVLPKKLYLLIKVAGVLLAFYVLYQPWKIFKNNYPIEISKEQQLMVEVKDWYVEQGFEDRRKYFLFPFFNVIADIDPGDKERFIEIWSFDHHYAPVGSVVIWDGHFGPNEGQIPLEFLETHPDFKKIKSFYPNKPFKTLNDYDFEVHVFERVGDSTLKK
jgi:hypothetical protein